MTTPHEVDEDGNLQAISLLKSNWDEMKPEHREGACRDIATKVWCPEALALMASMPNYSRYGDPARSPKLKAAEIALQDPSYGPSVANQFVQEAKQHIPEGLKDRLRLVESVLDQADTSTVMNAVIEASEHEQAALAHLVERFGRLKAAYALSTYDKSLTSRLDLVTVSVSHHGYDRLDGEIESLLRSVDPLDQAIVLGGTAIACYETDQQSIGDDLVHGIDIAPMRDATLASIIQNNAGRPNFGEDMARIALAINPKNATGRALQQFTDAFNSPEKIIAGAHEARDDSGFRGAGEYYREHVLGMQIVGINLAVKAMSSVLS